MIALAALLLSVAGARADTYTYTYTGNDFTDVMSPYTTSERVTGTITLTKPLSDNLPLTRLPQYSYSFTDGVQTLTQFNSSSFIDVVTNGTGQISKWNVGINVPGQGEFAIFTYDQGPCCLLDYGDDRGIFSTSYNDPGVWSGPAGISTPEPDTLSLSLSWMILFGLLAIMKIRTGQSCARDVD
jgi:hypothetical protein